MKVFLDLFVIAILLLTGCNSPSNEGQNDERSEHEARIIFGKSIDGVEIGDDTTSVISKLGRPDEIPITDYLEYRYTQGMYSGMTIDIILGKGVKIVTVYDPYSGVTETGIGIDTSRETVIQFLGMADETLDLNNDRVAETAKFLIDVAKQNLIRYKPLSVI